MYLLASMAARCSAPADSDCQHVLGVVRLGGVWWGGVGEGGVKWDGVSACRADVDDAVAAAAYRVRGRVGEIRSDCLTCCWWDANPNPCVTLASQVSHICVTLASRTRRRRRAARGLCSAGCGVARRGSAPLPGPSGAGGAWRSAACIACVYAGAYGGRCVARTAPRRPAASLPRHPSFRHHHRLRRSVHLHFHLHPPPRRAHARRLASTPSHAGALLHPSRPTASSAPALASASASAPASPCTCARHPSALGAAAHARAAPRLIYVPASPAETQLALPPSPCRKTSTTHPIAHTSPRCLRQAS